MKDKDKISIIKNKIEIARENLLPSAPVGEGIRTTLDTILDYIEFMITPSEDDEEETT